MLNFFIGTATGAVGGWIFCSLWHALMRMVELQGQRESDGVE